MTGMGDGMHTLSERIAVLEERMNTMQADLSAALDRFRTDQAILREDMAKRDTDAERRATDLRTDIAKRDTDAARRDKDNLRWVVGFGIAQMVLILAVVGAGFTVIGLLIT